jgi:ATP-dependent Lon protease
MTEKDVATEANKPQEPPESHETLPLLFLEGQVVFPMSLAPLRLMEPGDIKLIDDSAIGPRLLAMLTVRPGAEEGHGLDRAFPVGCVGRIMQLQHTPEGHVNVVVQALRRFRALGLVQTEPYRIVRVELIQDAADKADEIAPLANAVKAQMSQFIRLSPDIPDGAAGVLQSIDDAGFLADLVAGNLRISIEEKQKVLSAADPKERLEFLAHILARELQYQELSNKIQHDVKDSIDKGQREFFLRQQMKAIQDELGEGTAKRPEVAEYERKLEGLKLPDEVKKEASRELERLSQMNEASAEYPIITTYLDWIVELPWSISTTDQLDIPRAETILDEDHYGLAKVKRRIIEHLAVRKLKPDASGAILCFVGPPGVGKTSLGKSIARALDRKFTRMSLGGMRDEAEIRGHRKTYIGALPGRIIQNIRKAASNNPVFMLDEIDKVGSDFRGDPSSALLEVLDPAQNDTFVDHYLNVAFDLSKVMFIATANVLDTVPWALRDRMEVIEIPGYTMEEKLEIARTYLVPRQMAAHGLPAKRLRFAPAALKRIITGYTREAGVRNLEREIANVCRGCAYDFARGRKESIRIDTGDLRTYLGNEKFYFDAAERTRIPGVAVGMAWTATGGDILFVEATRMDGKGNLLLTGQLGDVMKESAQTALSYIRSNSGALGVPAEDFGKQDIHIHVPAGAVPKDGPSAGVTILSAIASLLTGKRVKDGLAMTGEITLRGLVLPVGGIKEKVLAAARAGIDEIVLPERCRNDLDEVPGPIKKRVRFHYVAHMSEVLRIALSLDRKGRRK